MTDTNQPLQTEEELRQSIATILYYEHLDSCDEGCGWKLEDELTSEATDDLMQLIAQRDAHWQARLEQAVVEGKISAMQATKHSTPEEVDARIEQLQTLIQPQGEEK